MIRARFSLLTACAWFLVMGCSWESGDSGDFTAWNDSYNWVNFSGVYRAPSGGLIVTDYNGTPGSTETTVTSPQDTLGTSVASQHTYSGTLANRPVSAGSMTVDCVGFHFADNGSGTLVGSVAGTSGTINYTTGVWTLNLGALDFGEGNRIAVTYKYVEGATTGSTDPGNTGPGIYSFVVAQTGNILRFTDSSGARYEGYISGVSTPGGNPTDTSAGNTTTAGTSGSGATGTTANQNGTASGQGSSTAAQGGVSQTPPQGRLFGEAIAQFEVQGTSAAGRQVTITGTLQLDYTTNQQRTSAALANRTMNGTWIEDSGATGDIVGSASQITVAL
jgi:hypothetical protein